MAASEAAEMIMRVDNIIRCAPRKRDRMWDNNNNLILLFNF